MKQFLQKALIPCHIAFLLLSSSFTYSQDDKKFRNLFREAEYFMITEDYKNAIEKYDQLLKMDSTNFNIHFLKGYCHLNAKDPVPLIINHLEIATQNIDRNYTEGSYFEKSAPPLVFFLLGRAYLENYELEKAKNSFENYKDLLDHYSFAEIEYVNRYLKSCELAKDFISNPQPVIFQEQHFELDPNSSFGNPVTSGNDSMMIFNIFDEQEQKVAMITKADGANWAKPVIIDNQLNLKDKSYPTSLSYNGKMLFLVIKNEIASDIYVSHFLNGHWTEAEKLGSPVNTKYLETYASISSDNKTLYFSSNRKGGWGGLDIYKTTLNKRGKWDKPVNLGFGINTYYNDKAPVISQNDSVLFFSSEGHETMGGYDVFYTKIDEEGYFTPVKNMGYPISTTRDDMFFYPVGDNSKAYFSRPDSAQPEKKQIVAALGFQLPGDMEIDSGVESNIENKIAQVDSAIKKSDNTDKSRKRIDEKYYYVLNNIRFDFNSWSLNENCIEEVERIAMMMKMHEAVKIELIGKADSVGSFEYNFELAKRRVMTVKNALIDNGVSEKQIMLAIQGEAFPVALNTYKDGTDSKEGRALNRSVIIRINNEGLSEVQIAEIFVPPDLVPEQEKAYCIFLLESNDMVDTIPEDIIGFPVSLIYTGNSKIYTLGTFNSRLDAIGHLDQLLELGYTDAGIMEKRKFEHVIRDRSEIVNYATANYTIQILALKNPTVPPSLKNMKNVKRYKGKDELFRYATGEYKTVDEANNALVKIKNQGYKQAFIRPLIYYQMMTK